MLKKQHSDKMLGAILALAWPTMLEQLLQTAVQYIDTAMVGSLGTQATAAVGATGTINWLVSSTISAIAIGFLSYIARTRGEGNDEKARAASAQSVLAVLACGIFFTALTLGLSRYVPVWMQVEEGTRAIAGKYFFVLYTPMLFRSASIIFGTVLRAAGDSKTPMRAGIAVNVINVILNFLLIYPKRAVYVLGYRLVLPGAGMGVLGAAVASAVAFTVGGLVIFCALWRHPEISPKGQRFRSDGTILRQCMKVAIPNALQRFGTSFGYVVFASMINSVGDVATAAHTVANTVESAFYIPGYGMQSAAATLAGNALGAQDGQRLNKLSRTILRIELLLMLISGGALFLMAPSLVGLFSEHAAVIVLGVTVLRMVALSEPFYGVSIIIEGMLQGMGRTVVPFVLNLMGMWLVRIVGTWICTSIFGLGLVAAWGCMIAHNLFLFVIYFIFYLSGKWNPLKDKI